MNETLEKKSEKAKELKVVNNEKEFAGEYNEESENVAKPVTRANGR